MRVAIRYLMIALPLLLVAAVSAIARAADANGADTASVQRGAYIATASDCTACHTAPGGQPFAGGLPIASPVGTIYSTNITPSAAGIGDYSEADFTRAVRRGVRKDGANLYPAMPYTSYRLLTDADMHDLYAYFIHAVAPINFAPTATKLPFPLNIRMSMMAWNLLFLSDAPFTNDPHQTAEWNRGAYLVNGPAHCGECHTPRGFLMEAKADQNLGGGQVGMWFAPNITSDSVSGIGSWNQNDIARFLSTGSLPGKARAGGSMGEAVEHSLQYLTPPDVNAIATYLASIPPIRDMGDDKSRFDFGVPGSSVGGLRGVIGVRSDDDTSPSGAELYVSNCASCHSVFGQGSKDKYYPSLFQNSVTGAKDSNNLIATILNGVQRTTSSGEAYMPGFGGRSTDPNQLSNPEIASLASYVFQQYGRPQTVSDEDVDVVRNGGPPSSLLLLARIGVVAAVAAVILILILFVFIGFRRRTLA